MNNKKNLLGLTVLAVYGVTLGYCLCCPSCNSKESCENPTQIKCNSKMASETKTYLDQLHYNADNKTSADFSCFDEYTNYACGQIYYKGCIYAGNTGCGLPYKPEYLTPTTSGVCHQYTATDDDCNPAGRAELHYGLFVVLLTSVVLGKLELKTKKKLISRT